MLVIMAERQVVTVKDEPMRRIAQMVQQPRHRGQVLALQLDQLEIAKLGHQRAVDRLHQRGFPHAARAPQQRIVGRVPGGEAAGVLKQRVARPVDPHQEVQLHPVYLRHRLQPVWAHMPDKAGRGGEIRGGQWRWRHALQRLCNAAQCVLIQILCHLCGPSFAS